MKYHISRKAHRNKTKTATCRSGIMYSDVEIQALCMFLDLMRGFNDGKSIYLILEATSCSYLFYTIFCFLRRQKAILFIFLYDTMVMYVFYEHNMEFDAKIRKYTEIHSLGKHINNSI